MLQNFNPHFYDNQKGSTLITALVILILIMMIGITAVVTSGTQYQLAGNLQFEDGAMNNTETSITTAENWLSTGSNYADAGFTTYSAATAHLHPIGLPSTLPINMTDSVFEANSAELTNNQHYMIQKVSSDNRLIGSGVGSGGRTSTGCNQVNTYLITSRGNHARGATKFVQSFYSVLSCPN